MTNWQISVVTFRYRAMFRVCQGQDASGTLGPGPNRSYFTFDIKTSIALSSCGS